MFLEIAKYAPSGEGTGSTEALVDDNVEVMDFEDAVNEFEMSSDFLDEFDSFSESLEQAEALHSSIEQYGITPGLVAFADFNGGLRASVSAIPLLQDIATEGYAPYSQEVTAATEGILETVKNATASFLKKAWDMITSGIAKIGSLIAAVGKKAAGAVSWFAGKTMDGAKAAGRTVKAHPVATVLGVLTLAAALPVVLPSAFALSIPMAAGSVVAYKAAVLAKLSAVIPKSAGLSAAAGKAATVAGDMKAHKAGLIITQKVAPQSLADMGKAASGVVKKIGETFSSKTAGLRRLPGAIKDSAGKALASLKTAVMGKTYGGMAASGGLLGRVKTGFGSVAWLFRTCWSWVRGVCVSGWRVVMGWVNTAKAAFQGAKAAAAAA